MSEWPLSRLSGLFWRFVILIFVLSFILPSSEFVGGMSEDAFVVWLVRLLWVVGLSAGLSALFWLAGRFRSRRGVPHPSNEAGEKGAPVGEGEGPSAGRPEIDGKDI